MDVKQGYRQTEVGVIPEDWLDITASRICELIVDCKNRTPPYLNHGEYAVVRTSNVRNGKFISDGLLFTDEKSYSIWTKRAIPKPGDILITREAPLGEVCFVPQDLPLCLGQRMMLYRPNVERVNGAYFLYGLMHPTVRKNLQKKIGGSTVGHARLDDIKEILIPLPPTKVEQEAIAEALSHTDALIEALEQLIAKKRHIKQGAMSQLLSGKKRLPGFETKPGTRQTEVGEIPLDWDVKFLKELCTSINDGTHYTPNYVESGVPFYSVENVTRDNFSKTKYITQKEHSFLIRRCKPGRGDILLSRIGSLGGTKLIDWDVNASIYVSLALLKPKSEIIGKYLYSYSKYSIFVRDIEKRSLLNATPQKINMGAIETVPVPVPSTKAEQEAIATVLSDMDTEITALEVKRNKTRQLKQGMMAELLTGRTRLI